MILNGINKIIGIYGTSIHPKTTRVSEAVFAEQYRIKIIKSFRTKGVNFKKNKKNEIQDNQYNRFIRL